MLWVKFSSKKSFPYFFEHIKNKSDFSVIKNHILYHKTDLIFYKVKTIFFRFLKTDLIFFTNQNQFLFITKTDLNFLSKNHFFTHVHHPYHTHQPNACSCDNAWLTLLTSLHHNTYASMHVRIHMHVHGI